MKMSIVYFKLTAIFLDIIFKYFFLNQIKGTGAFTIF